jgi:hypothetical protein
VGVVFFDAAGRYWGVAAADGVVGLIGPDTQPTFSRQRHRATTEYAKYALQFDAASQTATLMADDAVVFAGIRADELRAGNKTLTSQVFFGSFGADDAAGSLRVRSLHFFPGSAPVQKATTVVQEPSSPLRRKSLRKVVKRKKVLKASARAKSVFAAPPRAKRGDSLTRRRVSVMVSSLAGIPESSSSSSSSSVVFDTGHVDEVMERSESMVGTLDTQLTDINDLKLELAKMKAQMQAGTLRRNSVASNASSSAAHDGDLAARCQRMERERNRARKQIEELKRDVDSLDSSTRRRKSRKSTGGGSLTQLEEQFDDLRLENERLRLKQETLETAKARLEAEVGDLRERYHQSIDSVSFVLSSI